MKRKISQFSLFLASIGIVFSMCTYLISAGESGLVTALAPPWGNWSDFAGIASKDSKYEDGEIYLNTSPYTFQIYGQIYKYQSTDQVLDKALVSDLKLTVDSTSSGAYRSSQNDGKYYKTAISTSNFEPDSRKVTYKFKP